MGLSYREDLETPDAITGQLDRIVVGVDFTEPSLAVAEWVARCLPKTAELTLLHVTPVSAMPNVSGSTDHLSGERLRALRGALRGLASTMGRTRTEVEVRVGDPATQLATYANVVGADLVVVGASATYHVAPRCETATIERLLRRTSRPVLIARDVRTAPTTVLAAVADDADAMPVLSAAWRVVARPCAARVVGLRVVDEAATGSTEWLERSLRTAGIPLDASHAIVVEGEQVRAILDVAHWLRPDIIAVGTGTRTGEVMPCEARDDATQRLVRTATCSVLVAPHLVGIPPISPRTRSPAPRAGVHRGSGAVGAHRSSSAPSDGANLW